MATPTVYRRRIPVTGRLAGNLTMDYDRLDRRCRNTMDELVRRDSERFALHAGMPAWQINREREATPTTSRDENAPPYLIPALSKVARIVRAAVSEGRTQDELADYLRPVLDEIGADLAFRVPVVATIGSHDALSSFERSCADLTCEYLCALKDGKGVNAQEQERIERAAQSVLTRIAQVRGAAEAEVAASACPAS